MPKGKIVTTDRKQVAVRSKFKMGGRKSTKSGLHMTNTDLINMATDKNVGKQRSKAIQVLSRRGVEIPSSVAAEPEENT